MWYPNFSSVVKNTVTINHHSTSSTIELIVHCEENLNPDTSVFMDYGDFKSLVYCVFYLCSLEEIINERDALRKALTTPYSALSKEIIELSKENETLKLKLNEKNTTIY